MAPPGVAAGRMRTALRPKPPSLPSDLGPPFRPSRTRPNLSKSRRGEPPSVVPPAPGRVGENPENPPPSPGIPGEGWGGGLRSAEPASHAADPLLTSPGVPGEGPENVGYRGSYTNRGSRPPWTSSPKRRSAASPSPAPPAPSPSPVTAGSVCWTPPRSKTIWSTP